MDPKMMKSKTGMFISSDTLGNEGPTTSQAYRCDLCSKTFPSEKWLINHMDSHEEQIYNCKFCDKVFVSMLTYRRHLKSLHSNAGFYDFVCQVCRAVFEDQENFDSHMQIAHPTGRTYPCKVCGQDYANPRSLKRHIVQTHKLELEKEAFICQYCDEIFNFEKLMLRHESKMHVNKRVGFMGVSEDLQSQRSSLSYEQKVDQVIKGAAYPCDQCKRRFATQEGLANHTATHGKMQFKCEECFKEFKFFASYNRHKKVKHTDQLDSDLRCEICMQVFLDQESFTIHQQTVHQAQGNFPCDQCGEVFYSKNDLEIHSNITHVKPIKFSCQICDKYFSTPNLLVLHQAKNHLTPDLPTGLLPLPEPKKLPNQCRHCEKDFPNEKMRYQHEAVDHLKQVCAICDARYLTAEALDQHVSLVHRGIDYRCKICKLAFKDRKEVFDHVVTFHSEAIMDSFVEKEVKSTKPATKADIKSEIVITEKSNEEDDYGDNY